MVSVLEWETAMCQKELEIDLTQFQGPTYSGRDRGRAIRSKFELDQVDSAGGKVKIIVPESTSTITSSYILGMLENSIKKYRDEKALMDHYEFSTPERFREKITSAIRSGLRVNKSLGI